MTHPRDTQRLLERVLGSDGPELTCEQCFEQLDRYVELELASGPVREQGSSKDAGAGERCGAADDAIPGMRAHLEGCPACAEDHASLLAYLRSAI
ncbi:MAG: hypothetical protein ACTHM1_02785 [Solirubrobacteraceae bacterium]